MSFVTDRGPGFKHFTATFLFPSPWLCGLYLWREINPQHHRFVTALSNVHASIFHLIILYLPPYPPRAILLLKLSKCGPNLDFPISSCFSCCHTKSDTYSIVFRASAVWNVMSHVIWPLCLWRWALSWVLRRGTDRLSQRCSSTIWNYEKSLRQWSASHHNPTTPCTNPDKLSDRSLFC